MDWASKINPFRSCGASVGGGQEDAGGRGVGDNNKVAVGIRTRSINSDDPLNRGEISSRRVPRINQSF